MHVEVQVALNFLISFLFNKLPRRRVAQFGEELEATLKAKFAGHWYPEAPSKGSAYRCIRCAPPLERAVFEVAAYQAGMSLLDIEETLPHELTIWVDPGEVSYRLREGCPVKLLYSSRNGSGNSGVAAANGGSVELVNGNTATTTLNPEAQCFRPIVEQQQQQQHLPGLMHHPQQQQLSHLHSQNHHHHHHQNGGFLPSPVSPALSSPPTPSLGYLPTAAAASASLSSTAVLANPANNKSQHHASHAVTFTTAAFAATKFGSTKLKTNGTSGKKSASSGSSLSNGNGSSLTNHRTAGSPTDFGLFANHGKASHQQQVKSLTGNSNSSILGHNWSVLNGNGLINNHHQQQNSHRQQQSSVQQQHQQQQPFSHLRNGGNGGSTSPNQSFFAGTSVTPPQQQQHPLLNGHTTALDLLDFADLEGCWKVGLSGNNGNNNNLITSNIFHQQSNSQPLQQQQLDSSASIWANNNSSSSGQLMAGKKMDGFGNGFGNGGNSTFENLLLFGGDPFESNGKPNGQQQQQQQQQLGLLDNAQLALLSERLWDEIFSISPEENGATTSVNNSSAGLNGLINTVESLGDTSAAIRGVATTNGVEAQVESEVGPLFCSSTSSSFSLSSMSSPSLSTTSNESSPPSSQPHQHHQHQQQQQQQQLVNEFDSLSLNSNNSSTSSSSSVGSSYIN